MTDAPNSVRDEIRLKFGGTAEKSLQETGRNKSKSIARKALNRAFATTAISESSGAVSGDAAHFLQYAAHLFIRTVQGLEKEEAGNLILAFPIPKDSDNSNLENEIIESIEALKSGLNESSFGQICADNKVPLVLDYALRKGQWAVVLSEKPVQPLPHDIDEVRISLAMARKTMSPAP